MTIPRQRSGESADDFAGRLFLDGMNTAEISRITGRPEEKILMAITMERSRRLGRRNPYIRKLDLANRHVE